MSTCVCTHATAPRSRFSTRQCSTSHCKVCLRTVTTFPWPAQSPDLSPISNGVYLRSFGRRVGPPTSLNELEARLQQICNEMLKTSYSRGRQSSGP
ncbi:hypothetical protein TNCV_4262921 [Trichonephila clavipes]|nr:hypothetical protein TNCV_4262921 [Trichonephila clavipes]